MWHLRLISLVGIALLVLCLSLAAEEGRELPKGMTQEKLASSVPRQLEYVETRLLAGKSADKILNSGNSVAIQLLQESREKAPTIAKLIKKGQLEEAYWELQDLNQKIKTAMKLSRAKDVAQKQSIDEIESVRIVSDAYLDRAKQQDSDKGYGGEKTAKLYSLALEQRLQAETHAAQSEYQAAIEDYQASTETLKEVIAYTKELKQTELKAQLETARRANKDAHEEALRKGVNKDGANREARIIYEHALEKTAQAKDSEESNNLKTAIEQFDESARLFRKAVVERMKSSAFEEW